MNKLWLMLAAGLLILAGSSLGANAAPSGPQAGPTIQVRCALHSIRGTPPEQEGIMTFSWQSANASYVVIDRRGNAHHPPTGSIDEPRGGAFLFTAVGAGNRFARHRAKCFQNFRPGTGIDGHEWFVDESPDPKAYFGAASVITVTTPLAKAEIQSRISQLLSRKFGLNTAAAASGGEDIVLHSTDLVSHESLCESDGCNRDGAGLERRGGLDVWVEKQPQGGAATYKVHLLPTVLVRPAAGEARWDADPNANIVGLPFTFLAVCEITRLFCCLPAATR